MDLNVIDKDTFGDIEFERYKIDKYYKGRHLNFDFCFKVRNTNISDDYDVDCPKAILFYHDVYDTGSSGRIVPDDYVLYSCGTLGPVSTIEEWAQELNISKEMAEQLLEKLYSNCYKYIYAWYADDEDEDDGYVDIEDIQVVLEDEETDGDVETGDDYALYTYRVYGKDNIPRKIETIYSYYYDRYNHGMYVYHHIDTEFYIDDKKVNEDTFVKSLNVDPEEFKDLVRELEDGNEGYDDYYEEPDDF